MTNIKPIQETQGDDFTKLEHPAFALISASRVSGRAVLFGSDFPHNNFISIKISDAYVKRRVNRDWNHEDSQQIEVILSEAQWASFVSSMNTTGTPCTKFWVKGEGNVAKLPPPVTPQKIFNGEFKDSVKKARDRLVSLQALIKESSLSKKVKDEQLAVLDKAIQDLDSNIPFVVEQFSKHMEKTTEKAKIEVSAFAQSALQRVGLESLAHKNGGLFLDYSSEQRAE